MKKDEAKQGTINRGKRKKTKKKKEGNQRAGEYGRIYAS